MIWGENPLFSEPPTYLSNSEKPHDFSAHKKTCTTRPEDLETAKTRLRPCDDLCHLQACRQCKLPPQKLGWIFWYEKNKKWKVTQEDCFCFSWNWFESPALASHFSIFFPLVQLEVKCRIRYLANLFLRWSDTSLRLFFDQQIMRYWFAIQLNWLVNISFLRDTVVNKSHEDMVG